MVFSGKIVDSFTGAGIPYATVKIYTPEMQYTGIGVSATVDGEFKFSSTVIDWPNIAVVSAAEYEPTEWELYEDFVTAAKIPLVRKVKELDPVIITSGGGDKKANYAWLLLIPLAIAASKKKNAIGEVGFNTSTVITGAAILVAIKGFNLLNDILTLFGLGKDKDDHAFDNENENPDSPLKPTLYINAPADKKTKAFNSLVSNPNGSDNRVNDLAEELFSAFGSWDDDEAQAIGVFKKFRSQIEASCFAYIWEETWGYPDLLQWLKGSTYPNDRLDTGEIKEITDYLHNLPVY
jgi:hypothetical protein